MKHVSNSQEVQQFSVDALIIVPCPMLKTKAADWFCKNRGCLGSVTLSRSSREKDNSRCVCGWSLKGIDATVVSTFWEFLHNDEKLGKQPHNWKE